MLFTPPLHLFCSPLFFCSQDEGKFIGVSLGQGQEPVAEKALDAQYVEGGWVMLEYIELVAAWLPRLEKEIKAL